MTKLSLEYVVRQPKIASENPPMLLMLHGYGSNEQDLFSFADELPDELLIISARAPQTIMHGGYAWYTINFDAIHGKFSDTDEAKESVELIAKFLDELKEEFNFDENRMFLMGFSQGSILSYAVAFKYPEKVKNIIALSGYVMQDILPENKNAEDYKHLDFFISHGSVDQVIPVEWAQQAAPFLNQFAIKNVYSEYPVGHGVAPQNFFNFKKWIEERI
ncbi:alpha/beta hydrolase [Aureivirga sp. CE67]|uniref:alpha/beta hydrolase n=1 Tax=Aureivirga sp. CE67 TaxID=1788983 RepID=UPI0018CA5120|nr:alpha/beta hydrolase-fold protein [Aureivirga sp. CE67]